MEKGRYPLAFWPSFDNTVGAGQGEGDVAVSGQVAKGSSRGPTGQGAPHGPARSPARGRGGAGEGGRDGGQPSRNEEEVACVWGGGESAEGLRLGAGGIRM